MCVILLHFLDSCPVPILHLQLLDTVYANYQILLSISIPLPHWEYQFPLHIVIIGVSASPLLPSSTKLRQGNIFTGVCQSFCSQGWGVSASVHPRQVHSHPSRQVHPLPRQVPQGRYTSPQAGTHPPGKYTPHRQVPPQQVHPRAGTPPTTITAADDTYPTGMLSCYMYMYAFSRNTTKQPSLLLAVQGLISNVIRLSSPGLQSST